MPILTATPVVLDPDNLPQPAYNMKSEAGPFKAANGNWYLPEDQPHFGSALFPGVSVYLRPSSSSPPWAAQDTANDPNHGNDSAWTYDPATDKIYIATLQQGGGGNKICPFDCATNTFDPASALDGSSITIQFRNCVKLSNGDVLNIYEHTTGAGNIFYRRLSGGVWSAEQTLVVTGSPDPRFTKARVDSEDRVHVFWSTGSTPSDTLYYAQMDGLTGALNVGATAVFTLTGAGAGINNYSNILIDEVHDTVYLMCNIESTATDHIPRLAVGTPLSAPVFTQDSPDVSGSTIPSNQDQSMPMCLALDDSGHLVALWNTTGGLEPVSGAYTSQQIWMNTLTGGLWGSPVVFYDGWHNPPPGVRTDGDPSSFSDHIYNPLAGISVLKIPGDWILVSETTQTNGDFNDFTFIIAPMFGGSYNFGRLSKHAGISVNS